MDSYFDHIAQGYDKEFTHSAIGRRQRSMVHDFLQPRLAQWQTIFEVNCGTGEDALWFAQQGKVVTATDISAEMIRVAQHKADQALCAGITFRQLDVTDTAQLPAGNRYDLIFSDFGGLNCLSPDQLSRFLRQARKLILQDGGSIVLVMMSKGSLWESLVFLKRRQWRNAFRRFTNKPLSVNVDGRQVPTWYYNPSFFRGLKTDLRISHIQTIGFFLPPSYLEPIFARRPALLNVLFRMERWCCRLRLLAGFSDHYLIELKAA